MTDKLDLEELKRLYTEASPTPWQPLNLIGPVRLRAQDRALILAMHNALPALISRLEKAEAVVKAARNSVDDQRSTRGHIWFKGTPHAIRLTDAIKAYDLAFPLETTPESGEKT